MLTKSRKMWIAAMGALALVFTLGTARNAQATFETWICDSVDCSGTAGTNYLNVTDNGAGDSIATTGVISSSFTFGTLTVLVNTSQSKPIVGSAGTPQMDMTFTVTGIGTVWMYTVDTDFTGIGTATGRVDGNATGTSAENIGLFGGDTNTNPVSGGLPGTAISIAGGVSGSPFSLTLPSALVGNTVNPYMLTMGLFVNRTTTGTTTGDYNVRIVPEPASMLLFGLGLIGLAVWGRKRLLNK